MPKTKQKKQNNRSGFTLVELIIVLVILVVLMAMLLPALTGYIEKTHNAKAMAACRQCVVAAQSISVEEYGLGDFAAWSDAANAEERHRTVMERGNVNEGNIYIDSYTPFAALSKLVYIYSDTVVVSYENGTYTVGGALHTVGSVEDLNAMKTLMDSASVGAGGPFDSGAVGLGKSSDAIVNTLKESGFDMGLMGITSWRYSKGEYFRWTPQDISGMQAGDTIVYYQYSWKFNAYTVRRATIQIHNDGYPTLSATGDVVGGVGLNTFEEAQNLYNQIMGG